jgi:transposase
VARRSAIAARAEAQTKLRALIVTAPEPLRDQLRGLSTRRLLATGAALRPDPAAIAEPVNATKTARAGPPPRQLSEEIDDLDDLSPRWSARSTRRWSPRTA